MTQGAPMVAAGKGYGQFLVNQTPRYDTKRKRKKRKNKK
jgi:hypothetical protein